MDKLKRECLTICDATKGYAWRLHSLLSYREFQRTNLIEETKGAVCLFRRNDNSEVEPKMCDIAFELSLEKVERTREIIRLSFEIQLVFWGVR